MRTERLHCSATYGVLRMDVYAFGAEQAITRQETPASAHSILLQEAAIPAAAATVQPRVVSGRSTTGRA